ncbi:MAG: Gldg family protein [Treponema sp.]|nr:Gldg family protein [Treponema sp.]
MKKFLSWLKGPQSDFILFVVFLILLNIVSANFFKKIDLTEPKSFSLSNASKSIVANLEEPLNIRVFFDDDLPSPYNNVSQYVKDLLEEYKAAGNKNFKVSYMDMGKEENQETAQTFGIRQVQDQILKNNEVSFKLDYRGIAITYGDNVEILDPIESSDGFEYTLTSTISKMISSSDLLAALSPNQKLRVDLYMTQSLDQVTPGTCDSLVEIVQTGFNTVNAKQQNRLEFKYNMLSENDEIIEKYGLPGVRIRNQDNSYTLLSVGVVLSSGDEFRVVPVQLVNDLFGLSIEGLNNFDELLTQSIQSLLSKPNQIAYITGHNEIDLEDTQYGAAGFKYLISGSYELVPVNLTEQDIPLSINTLIVNGPTQDYSETELFKIDQFIMKGGNAMFFLDPFVENPEATNYTDQAFLPNKHNIDTLLEKYGVKRGMDVVLDPSCAQNSRTGDKAYFMPLLQKKQMNKNHPVSKNLGFVYMYLNGSIDISEAEKNKEIQVSVLAKSSDKSWPEPVESFYPSYVDMYPASGIERGAQNLCVLLEGKFNSAFTKAPVEDESFIASSRLSGKVFVMSSAFITRVNHITGDNSTAIELFMQNAVDYLNSNEDFCVMRTKGLALDTLEIKSPVLAAVIQYFNQFGLPLLVIIAGIIVWRLRAKRRRRINKEFNPDDKRFVEKTETKAEK